MNTNKEVLFRFHVGVPKDATVRTATISFFSYEDNEVKDATMYIYAQLTANSTRPNPQINYNITGVIGEQSSVRMTSVASIVTWQPEPWVYMYRPYTTPDVKGIIQEIVDLPDWNHEENPYINFIIQTIEGSRTAMSVESGMGAKLFIVWEQDADFKKDETC